MLLWTTLFINQAAFIWMAMEKGIATWLIFIISFYLPFFCLSREISHLGTNIRFIISTKKYDFLLFY